MTALEIISSHARELQEATGISAEVIGESTRILVILKKVRLPEDLSKIAETDVLFAADLQYPHSAMDMFWTELDVVRQDGSQFERSEHIEPFLNKPWRRFSWHRNATWNPSGNPLMDHYAFFESRWLGEKKR